MSTFLSARKTSVLIFLVCLVYFAAPLGNRPFYTRGEGREAIVVKAMLETNNWVLPHEEPIDIATKPPMFHWLGAITATMIGHTNEFAIRFPSALCASAATALFFLWIVQFSTVGVALLSTLILACSTEWIRSASHARVDMCFAAGFFVASAAFLMNVLHRERTGRASIPYLTIATLAMAFATLSKGPAGFILPSAVIVLFEFTRGPIRKFIFSPAALAIGLCGLGAVALSALWYVAAYQQGGDEFLHIHFYKENLGRFVPIDGKTQGHEKPFYFAFLYLVVGTLPWSIFTPVLIAWGWTKARGIDGLRGTGIRYATVWFAVVMLVVSVSESKRDVYLLPAFPALAYLLGEALVSIDRERSFPRQRAMSGYLLAGVGVILLITGMLVIGFLAFPTEGTKLISGFRGNSVDEILGTMTILRHHLILIVGIFAFGATLIYCATQFRRHGTRHSSVWLGGASLAITLALNTIYAPEIAKLDSPREFIDHVETVIPKTAHLEQYRQSFFPAMFYIDRYAPFVAQIDENSQTESRYFLVRRNELPLFEQDAEGERMLFESETNAANGDDRLLLMEVPAGLGALGSVPLAAHTAQP
ncbi:MAG: glycosyltransferase family 39 protein [Deltaproteobacteria bacterium]|nr:glycosyltransferase family 39 protein [Deltaproteobacteria bacterium]